jgi:replicative DNA helicase
MTTETITTPLTTEQMMSTNETDNWKKKRQKPSIPLDTLVYGKVPPQAKELEDAVLGTSMVNVAAAEIMIDLLKPQSFYVDANQLIFKAIKYLHDQNVVPDILVVVQRLKATEELELVGGPYAITKLTNQTTANVETYCQIIQQKFIQREMIRFGGEIINEAYEESTDAFVLLDHAEANFTAITQGNMRGDGYKTSAAIAMERVSRIETLRANKNHLTGVPTGFRPLDITTNGWQPTDLIIIAARPSVGKTAFALNLARNAMISSIKPTPVGFFSLEMSSGQLIDRVISCEGKVELEQITSGKFINDEAYHQFRKSAEVVSNYPFYVDDTPALNISEFKSRARQMVRKHKVGLIIVDYLQLMSGKTDDVRVREQEISSISRNLKSLAKELKVPIIALSQLSRALEKEKRDPQLSDLRESGSIEQDADIVMFITRPDYQKTSGEIDPMLKHCIDLHIKKHRSGKLDKVPLYAVLSIQKCFDLEQFKDYKAMQSLPQGNWAPMPTRLDDDEDLPF